MVTNIGSALSAYRQAGGSAAMKGMESASETKTASFSDTLKDFVGDAVDSVKKSEELAAQGAVGKADLQEVILAVSNAEMMLQTITSIRDKVITAYQEVLRSSV
jgi:flagellar hook-basal body complex protein FliE